LNTQKIPIRNNAYISTEEQLKRAVGIWHEIRCNYKDRKSIRENDAKKTTKRSRTGCTKHIYYLLHPRHKYTIPTFLSESEAARW